MVQIIVGEKGKGKTKVMISNANDKVKESEGTIAYIDKSNKHMYELNNKLRLINAKDYLVDNYNEFLGFISGLASRDHDLECVYIDSLLKVAHITEDEVEVVIDKLERISEQFNINFVVCISVPEKKLPDRFKEKILLSL